MGAFCKVWANFIQIFDEFLNEAKSFSEGLMGKSMLS